jgi:excisionase family DNA binding protein
MLPTTVDAITAILRADPTVTPEDRAVIIASIRNHGRQAAQPKPAEQQETRLLRRAEVARRLGCSHRTVDNLARKGSLPRVLLPGRKRAIGFRLADFERLLNAPSLEGVNKNHHEGQRK